jgi:hypothetical protein
MIVAGREIYNTNAYFITYMGRSNKLSNLLQRQCAIIIIEIFGTFGE